MLLNLVEVSNLVCDVLSLPKKCFHTLSLFLNHYSWVWHLHWFYFYFLFCNLGSVIQTTYRLLEQWPKSTWVCFMFQLRNAMVNRRTGTFSMEVKKTVDRGVRLQISVSSGSLSDEGLSPILLLLFQRRVLKMHNDYYYTDIKGTPFRWSSYCNLWVTVSPCFG